MFLSYDIDFNVCDLCDAFAEWVGLKKSFSMVYKFPVKYSFLEDVLCSNHYLS